MQERPKVLFCMHMPPPVHGAAIVGKQIYDSELIRSSFDCIYLNPAASSTVKGIGHFSVQKVIKMLQFYHKLCKIIRTEKPQLVYVTPSTWDWGFYRDFFLVWLVKRFRCPIVAHFHNKPQLSFTQKWYNKWLYKKFFKDIHTIFLANKLADPFRAYLDDEHIHICPNGMPEKLEMISRKEIHSPYKFLFVSNMMEEKGVLVLLEACTILRNEGRDFRCDFVGQWSDITEQCFNEICETHSIADVVYAHGPKYGTEKDVFFNSADAFVFPTYYHGECLSLVVLEAMQHALPIITTAEGALAEVVDNQNSGFIVERQNAKALAEKMQYLIEHPDMGREMGKRGRGKYEREYTDKIFEKRLCAILKSCVKS